MNANNRCLVALCLAFLIRPLCSAQVYRFTTIVGQAGQPGSADGTNGSALFSYPSHLGLDTNGNVYVCDRGNQTIRLAKRLGTNWVVTTVAGLAGQSGSADGTNSDARFDNPSGVVPDGAGNLYISDWSNHTFRKAAQVGTNWVVTTLAGTTNTSFSPTYDGTNSGARFGGPHAGALDPHCPAMHRKPSYPVARWIHEPWSAYYETLESKSRGMFSSNLVARISRRRGAGRRAQSGGGSRKGRRNFAFDGQQFGATHRLH